MSVAGPVVRKSGGPEVGQLDHAQAPLDILGLTFQQFTEAARFVLPKGHGIARDLYPLAVRDGQFNPRQFPISADSAALWEKHFTVSLLDLVKVVEEDGEFGTTAKAILRTRDGYEVECVRIPMRTMAAASYELRAASSFSESPSAQPLCDDEQTGKITAGQETNSQLAARSSQLIKTDHTLCISSQVGCKMGCTFCETGRMGLIRHLTAAEIVSEVVTVRATLGWQVKNIVFMGMGEALDNTDNVIQALTVLMDQRGLHYSQERITVCTSGHAEGIARLAQQQWKRLNLSISLNAANDDARSRIMPVNRKTPLAELQKILAAYPQRRNFTLGVNYCLMPGLNDARHDAAAIAEFCKPLGRIIINLIPYNPGNAPLTRAPSEEEIVQFIDWLREENLPVRRRITKGRSIMAACGQLGNVELRKKRTTHIVHQPMP
jgi:23S rRNA (adenine2503-C2)-methyltransferase